VCSRHSNAPKYGLEASTVPQHGLATRGGVALTDTSITQTDWPYYKAEYDAGRMSQGAIAKQLGITQGAVSRRFKAMASATVNGNLPALRPAHPDAPERISALPVHSDASGLDDIKSRLATLEAFMAAVQAQQRISALPAHPNAPVHRIAPERTEPPTWVNRGTHLAADMVEAVKAYATEHRMEIREVIDLALRSFFAEVGERVRDG
jgi:hypothetical protein